ncbi:NAD-dependent epimerase/dehydratase family protein [Kineosporia babensis]|uniref:NAD-dependent epimerase/dehydratase family protein n=1 Tax=Kineosporia babensis TaxID=499548 RepID=A0A9X1NLW9_9ACTN|nr:NAD-dependent epimerase/dehydratase family protein [Kineosporia babensis]MCD5316126.1 NAD-dependent epimerase/dehydratase family protein [Kineosporia babensis]
MRSVLVTGAAGFIGGCVARGFARERGPETVHCLVRTQEQAKPLLDQGYQVTVGDITDSELPQHLVKDCQTVVHAAAFMKPGPREDIFAVNVEATDRLAQAAAQAKVDRFIFISSIEAYGEFGHRILTEDQPYLPTDHAYAESKIRGEQAITERFQQTGSDAYVHLRPGMVYGPHSQYWTHGYLQRARSGRIRVLGRGGRIYPVHEDDLVAAVTSAAERPLAAGQTFNLVNDEHLTWWDWALAHHALTGTNRPRCQSVWLTRLLDKINRSAGNPIDEALRSELRTSAIPHDKARHLLGWEPRPFQDGIRTCKAFAMAP